MSNGRSDVPMASSPGASSGVLVVLKQKMQNLRDELEKYRDMYEEKCEEVESERSRRNEVNKGVCLNTAPAAGAVLRRAQSSPQHCSSGRSGVTKHRTGRTGRTGPRNRPIRYKERIEIRVGELRNYDVV